MGYGLRYFIAANDGALTRVPTARYHRWFSEGEVREDGRLEADANHFWWPTDAQLSVLGNSLRGQ
jgi:hypothetical protein